MKATVSIIRHTIAVPLFTTLAAAALPAPAMADTGLFLTGYNANWYDQMAGGPEGGISSDVLCGAEGVGALQTAERSIMDRLSQRLGGGVVLQGNSERDAAALRSELCQGGPAFVVEPHAITYSGCRFTMDQQSILMDMRMPTGDVDGAMDVADMWKAEVMRIPLYKPGRGDQGSPAAQWDAAIEWSGPGDTKTIAGHPATRWEFGYATDLGFGGGTGGMSMSMKTDGHGYFSKAVPGFELLEDFYRRFSEGISFDQGGGSSFGGLMNTWVEVLERGVPLEMDQTVTSSMQGMGAGSSTRSLMKVASLQLVDLPGDFCTRALVPDYFEVQNAGQGFSGMTASPGAGSTGAGAAGAGAQAEDGMSALGDLMEMMNSAAQQGYAVPGQQQAPAANPAGQAAAASAGGAASPGSGMPSSADLTTDDLTQSVQMHLQALGYDPGNTDGDLSTNTIIAISQFQAEKGMEVTGEVTPQLLGILGAAVDMRR
jgi:hypothetical protein